MADFENPQTIEQRKQKLQLIVLIVALVLFVLFLLLGVWNGFKRGQSLATLHNADQILTALQTYKTDQGEYPSVEQYSSQKILSPFYLDSYPQQVAHSGACSGFSDFKYSQTRSDNFTFKFCLNKSAKGLSAGVHTVSNEGIQN